LPAVNDILGQGDQWGDCFLWAFFNINEADQIFGLLFPMVKGMYVYIDSSNNGLGYILGDFLLTNLVTLIL
jgi:hypothetical protein